MKCGYIRHIWEFGWCREIEEKHTGQYGARGQKREKRKKASREEIRKRNQWKRKRDVRRLIKWNFRKHDYWLTITYRKGERPSYQEMKKDMEKLIRSVRREYRKHGKELKYIKRMGIGKKGGPHMHILVNRFSDNDTGTDIIFSECWKKGHVNIRTTHEAGGYKDLANYITKPKDDWEPAEMESRYTTSKNLIRKEPKEKTINKRSLADEHGNPILPKAPKGYYVDEDSVEVGKNPVTGYYYRHYTLVKLDRRI